MSHKYGNRESYDLAIQNIKDGRWKVDPEKGYILGHSQTWGWRPIGSPRDGYMRVKLGYERKQVSAHRVVWEYVNGESDLNLTINHINGNSLDNSINNLELVPNAENSGHAHRTLGRGNGSRNKGTMNPQAKLNEANVTEIKRRLRDQNGKGGNALAKEFGVSPMTISNIKHGVVWKHV